MHTHFLTQKLICFCFPSVFSLSFSLHFIHTLNGCKRLASFGSMCLRVHLKAEEKWFWWKTANDFFGFWRRSRKKRYNFSPYIHWLRVYYVLCECMQMHVPNRIFGILWIIILRRICRRKTRILFIVKMCARAKENKWGERQSQPVQIDKFYTPACASAFVLSPSWNFALNCCKTNARAHNRKPDRSLFGNLQAENRHLFIQFDTISNGIK